MHRELRNWADLITQQREERLDLSCRIFPLRKMLTFCASAYTPCTSQSPQSFISHVIAGIIGRSTQTNQLPPIPPNVTQSQNPHSSMRSQSSSILIRGSDKTNAKTLRMRRQELGVLPSGILRVTFLSPIFANLIGKLI